MKKLCWVGNRSWFAQQIMANLLVLVCVITFSGANVYAQSAQIFLNIPQQALVKSLDTLAAKAGLSLIYSIEDIDQKKSQAISGNYSPSQALELILKGTGLAFEFTSETTVSIRKNSRQASQSALDSKGGTSVTAQMSREEPREQLAQAGERAGETKREKASESKETEGYTLEETVVTATKTGETKLQETPISISAFSDEFLENTNVRDLWDLTLYSPNAQFEFFGPGRPTLFFRGVGSKFISYGQEGTVGVYLDGVYTPRALAGFADFFDLERVEILRGPQGTLYGRGTAGGAVNLISKPPSDELELKMGLEIGDYDQRRVDGTISGPIVKDKVKARVTFSDRYHDDYINNLTGPDIWDEDSEGVRGAVEFDPTDKIEITVRGDYFRESDKGQRNKLFAIGTRGAGAKALAAGFPLSTLFPDDFWDVAIDRDPFHFFRFIGGSATAAIELPYNLTLRSITAYRENAFASRQDTDATPLPYYNSVQDSSQKTFTQELQLNGSFGRWTWITGFYYLHSKEEIFNSDEFELFLPGLIRFYNFKYITDAYAPFGNIRYALTDKLSLEAGVRYDWEEADEKHASFSTNIPFPPFNITDPPDKENWDEVTYRFGADYKVWKEALLYAIISTGFKPGGYASVNPVDSKWLDPEELTAYEIGLKSDWFDNRLRVNGAFFYYDYQDKQVTSWIDVGVFKQDNAAESEIYGGELEILARPLRPLTLNFALSYLHAEYDKFIAVDANRQPLDVSGNKLENSPEWKIAFGAQYVVPVTGHGFLDGFLTFRGDLAWTDRQFFTHFEDKLVGQSDYTVIDGLVRFETSGGHWSFDLFGRNLTEEEYAVNKNDFGGDTIGNLGAPRTFGGRVVYRY